MDLEKKLCVLCFFEDGESFSELSKANILEDLKRVYPNFTKDFGFAEESLVCHACAKKLNSFARFKEEIISNEVKLETHLGSDLVKFLSTLSKDVDSLCRTCLTTSQSNEEVLERNWIDFEDVLLQCDIKLNKQAPLPSRLCNSCYSKLEAMKDFMAVNLKERIKEIKAEPEQLTYKKLTSIIREVTSEVKMSSQTKKSSPQKSQQNENQVIELDNDLHVNTIGTPKMYKSKKSTTSESPSTSQSSAEKIMNGKTLLKKMKEQIQQMQDSIDASPSENHADVTLNINEHGFPFDTPASEYNVTQELIDVLEGRLNENTTIDETTKELIDVLEGRFNDNSSCSGITVTTGPKEKVVEKRQLRQKTINEEVLNGVELNKDKPQPRKVKSVQKKVITVASPPKRKRGRPRKEKNEPPVKKPKTAIEQSKEVGSESDENITEIEKKLNNRPLQVTVIKGKRRTNKAQLDKTWQELTGASVTTESPPSQPSSPPKPKNEKDAGVEITVVKKRGKQSAGVKPKKEVVWMYCTKCSFKTYAQNSFIQHQLIHSVMSELPTLYCEHCRFNTTSEELMTQHTNTHETANLAYKCVFCDDFFKKKTSCMYHTLRHDDQDVASQFYCLVYNGAADEEYFECYQCDYQNTEESPMPDHVIDHTIEIPKNPMLAKFRCEFCPFLTKKEEVLDRHVKLHHTGKNKGKKKVQEDPQALDDPPLLKCDKCHYMTRHPRSLVNHIGLKHNRSIPPLVAGEALAAKAANEGRTMYYCNECSYSTYRKLNMPRHMLVHRTKENMEMHECPHCIFETKHRRSYTRHMEAKHGVVV